MNRAPLVPFSRGYVPETPALTASQALIRAAGYAFGFAVLTAIGACWECRLGWPL